ncbi:uncharacterized protein METZ01_LOCUS392092 [marine metagenome]|uniref:Ig-like domain-containing protein n=1 Tax=marine metagenome TaxID=408172 RepID=A0A382UZY1_9ZZZZ
MSTTNATMLLIVCFLGLLTTKVLDDRQRAREIEKQNRIRARVLAEEQERQRLAEIELAKCRVTIPHDGDKETITAMVGLNVTAVDPEKDELKYEWIQSRGNPVELKPNPGSAEVTFEGGVGEYVFTVNITDSYGITVNEEQTVVISKEPNEPPNADVQCPLQDQTPVMAEAKAKAEAPKEEKKAEAPKEKAEKK